MVGFLLDIGFILWVATVCRGPGLSNDHALFLFTNPFVRSFRTSAAAAAIPQWIGDSPSSQPVPRIYILSLVLSSTSTPTRP